MLNYSRPNRVYVSVTTFLGLEICNDIAAYGWFRNLRFHQKHLNLCSEDERM